MKAVKAGIWMDHNHAYLIEFTTGPMTAAIIESPLNSIKKPNLQFGEARMHATEQRARSSYYKELKELVRGYKEIILFGPGTARKELFNLLYENHVLQKVDIKTVHTGKLTSPQMNAFVRKHFTSAKLLG